MPFSLGIEACVLPVGARQEAARRRPPRRPAPRFGAGPPRIRRCRDAGLNALPFCHTASRFRGWPLVANDADRSLHLHLEVVGDPEPMSQLPASARARQQDARSDDLRPGVVDRVGRPLSGEQFLGRGQCSVHCPGVLRPASGVDGSICSEHLPMQHDTGLVKGKGGAFGVVESLTQCGGGGPPCDMSSDQDIDARVCGAHRRSPLSGGRVVILFTAAWGIGSGLGSIQWSGREADFRSDTGGRAARPPGGARHH